MFRETLVAGVGGSPTGAKPPSPRAKRADTAPAGGGEAAAATSGTVSPAAGFAGRSLSRGAPPELRAVVPKR